MHQTVKFADKNSIFELLQQNGIEYHLETHPALDTVPQGLEYFKENPPKGVENYTFLKNLFLKNKAGGFILLTSHPASLVDFKTLCKVWKTKSGNIRQAEPEQLVNYLNLQPGSVTPFGMLNLTEQAQKEVQFYFDKAIDTEYIGIHPMENTATIFMKTADLEKIFQIFKIQTNIIDLKVVDVEKVGNEKEQQKVGKDPKEKEGKEKEGKGGKGKDNKGKEANVKMTVEKNVIQNADDDQSILGIIAKKNEDFSQWYKEVIVKSDMIEYYEISGCYILRPWSYQIWEAIQQFFDKKIKEIGVENAYFPLFVSQEALFKEKEHVQGFSPEVAWVTKSGSTELKEPIAIRPTSETIMYPAYAKWIRSHRDLPLLLNQWTNIVRWEFKDPTPFIRTREFLWQEGHTAHSSYKEAEEMVFQILEFYRHVYEELLAIPVIPGRKTENEKFAGGMFTTTVETLIPANGKGIQCATSHMLGQNFSKMFDIGFLDEDKTRKLVWQTSWGLTTRSIGVATMVHGDDDGLILPPRIAPIQLVIIPIIKSKDDPAVIQAKANEIYAQLKKTGIRVKLDLSDLHNPGWKYAHWEVKGVPLRIEFGSLDMGKDQVTLFCRDTKEKFPVKYEHINETICKMLEVIQQRMFEKAKSELEKKKSEAEDFPTFLKLLSIGNMVLTPWCGVAQCEVKVKEKVKEICAQKGGEEENVVATTKTLCIPLTQDPLNNDAKCFFCGEKAEIRVLWGRTY